MRELIVTEFVSLDGVMEAPGGEPGYAHTGWVARAFSEELGAYKLQEQLAVDALLLGRRTFESFAGAWPQGHDEMADKINSMQKHVVSRTLRSTDWQPTTIIDSDPLRAIVELKQGDGGPIMVVGSRTLAQAVLGAGLVDRLHLQVFPLVLGSGERLFHERKDAVSLELLSSQALPNGVLAQSYRVP